ncbi:RNA polymerase sigma factor [Prosthecobacter sp.]|uniref:RNA polymerase sigma factor n=1 Tax=Prosthecobacter sp. TaxID=1965333 RepID=UPI0037834D9E
MMDAHQHLLSRYHRQGDAEAFAVLVREHGGMVFATARRVTGDAALAEDVAQETFLELARSGQGRVKTVAAWLHRVAWSKACNARRGESRRRRHEDQAAVAAEIASSSASGEPAWEELETQVDAALNELPEALRELLVAHYLEGRTQQEMAARAGVSQSTISRQIEAGVCELRTNLRRQGMMCGAGLAVFLSAQHTAAAALPATLSGSLGKLALSGAGSSAAPPATVSATSTFLAMTTSTKVLIATATATAAAALSLPLMQEPLPPHPPAEARRPAPRVTPVVQGKPEPAAVSARPHYRPPAVSPQVQQKVDAMLKRFAGMKKGQAQESEELNALLDRVISATTNDPEFSEEMEKRASALPRTDTKKLLRIDFDIFDGARGRAMLEAAVSNDPKLMRDWFLNTLDGAIFEFAFDPNLERTSNGVSLEAPPQQQPAASAPPED